MIGDKIPVEAHRAAEKAARFSYGRLIAILASRTRDMAAAEDALADAFRSALETWPVRGIPDQPEAWLLTAARHRLDHAWRHEQVKANAKATLEIMGEQATDISGDISFRDERLKLLFVCAHPSIDVAIQAPLMLQTVLGLEATHIASAFLVSPAAMSQRLVRAKNKIRDAGITFRLPDEAALQERMTAVLAAIYATYGTGWGDVLGSDPKLKGLTNEAIWLARALVSLSPKSPEAAGLLALMLYCEARRSARWAARGVYVPLDQQDTSLWSRSMIEEAEALLGAAANYGVLGRFQLEAAIQSLHIERRITGRENWLALLQLYDLLLSVAPTTGIRVARASALAQAGDAAGALAQLDEARDEMCGYQPYWATRAHVLKLLKLEDGAQIAFKTAAGLTEDEGVRAYLLSEALLD